MGDTAERDAVFELGSTISDWDDAYYHRLALPFYDRLVAKMLHALGSRPGTMVLDAGCGPGVHTIRAAKLGRHVRAIDVSKTMLDEAQRRVQKAGVRELVEFSEDDLTKLTLPSESFQHAFSWGVVVHIREIETALDELSRIVKPGGALALYVTNASALDHKIEAFGRWLLARPLPSLMRYEAGEGASYSFHGQTLWVWRLDSRWLVREMGQRGLKLKSELMGSFTELHTKLTWLKIPLLLLNDVLERLGGPKRFAATKLLVFEKA